MKMIIRASICISRNLIGIHYKIIQEHNADDGRGLFSIELNNKVIYNKYRIQ